MLKSKREMGSKNMLARRVYVDPCGQAAKLRHPGTEKPVACLGVMFVSQKWAVESRNSCVGFTSESD